MMKKKVITCLLFLGILIGITGCWSNREFDSLALVKGVGIDLADKENRIKFSVQVSSPKPQAGEPQPPRTVVNSVTGYTVFEANRNLIKTLGRKPFYPHNEVIIFGEELARKGLKPYVDFLNRDPEIRRRSYILIAKGKAEDILNTSHQLEDISASAIKQIVDGRVVLGTTFFNDLRQFTASLLSDTKATVTSVVEVKKQKNDKKQIYIEGAAMFKKDKLLTWLNRKETRGLNLVLMPSEIKGPIIIKAPAEEKRITIEVINVKSSLVPKLENGEFKMKIEIKAKGNVAEVLSRQYKLTVDGTKIKQLNRRFAQVLRNEIISAVNKSQRHGADIFGFGEIINNKFPKKFKHQKDNWNQIYANLPVFIEVETEIKRLGLIEEGTRTYK